jgi:protein tyrosine/serine phosphatase
MKIKNLILLHILLISNAFGGITSSIPGTVAGLSIPNSHYVINATIIRGQTPRSIDEYTELKNLGVKSVLIFKNETKDEVKTEIQTLKNLKIAYTHIDFPWKDIAEFAPVCNKAKDALKLLIKNNQAETKTYFHCTVGEDRTGFLAGLLLLRETPQLALKDVFQEELCAKGYEAGDTNKIQAVVKTVRENLTPVFLKFSYLLKISNNNVEKIDCNYDFLSDQNFLKSSYNRPLSFKCGK